MIESYNYPLLIPTKLVTGNVKTYTSAPTLATQSPNHRYLLIEQPGSSSAFDLYDLSKPTLPATPITVPANIISQPTSTESWQVVAWANDNQHILLDHIFDGKTEYILLDTANPSQSVNLTQTLSSVTFTAITLDNQHYNQYYLYNAEIIP